MGLAALQRQAGRSREQEARSSGGVVGPASRLGRKEARAVPATSTDCGE